MASEHTETNSDTKPTDLEKTETERSEERSEDIATKSGTDAEKKAGWQSQPTQRSTEIESGEEEFRVTFRLFLALVSLSMVFIGSQIVPLFFVTLITIIGNDLKSGNNTIWLSTGGTVAVAAAAPFVGPAADYYGRKPVLLFGVFMSMIGHILSAATPNTRGFIAGQAIGGFGVAIEELIVIAAVAEIVPVNRRGRYIGFVILGFVPFCPGTYYAQAVAAFDWRWVAAWIAIWNALTLVGVWFFYNPPPRQTEVRLTASELMHHFDLIGALLAIGGVVVLLVGVTWGGVSYPWGSAHVVATLTIGIFTLLVFGIWEKFFAKNPLFPGRLHQHPRPFFALMFNVVVAGINYVSVGIFWTVTLIAVYGTDFKQTGAKAMPIGFCILAGAVISSFLLSIFKGNARSIILFFCIMQTTGLACIAALKTDSLATAMVPLIIGLIGVGGVLIPNQVIVTILVPEDLIATGTSLTVCLRAVGQAIGLTIYYNNFKSHLTKNALKYLVIPALAAGIFDPNTIEALVNGNTGANFATLVKTLDINIASPTAYNLLRDAMIHTFAETLPLIWYITIAFGVSACIACIFLGDLKKYMDSKHVVVHME